MKISVVSGILGDYSLDESLAYLSALDVDEFELGVGGYPGKAHADALVLSKDRAAREQLLETFKKLRACGARKLRAPRQKDGGGL